MKFRIQKVLFVFYILILGFFYGAIMAGQLLGFSGAFWPLPAILISVLVGAGGVWAYFHWGGWNFYGLIFQNARNREENLYLDKVLYFAALAVILLLIVLPLARWPYSPVSDTLTWDAGLYHFPKAIELFRTGTFWDMGVPYGEYPVGYESLLALGLTLTQNEMLFGTVHALIAVFLLLSIWLLECRYTGLPPALLLFGTSLLVLSGSIPVESNLWWVFYHLITTIGKNDLLLSAAVLAVILHAPVGPLCSKNPFHAVGVMLATMIAISVKPNAIFLATPIWLGMVWTWWKLSSHSESGRAFLWKRLAAAVLVMVPGTLWLLRNYLATGRFFSETVNTVQGWSILSNWNNPCLYQHLPRNLIILGSLFGILLILTIWKRRPSGSIMGILAILFLKFIATPASAFSGNTQVPAEIAWRFAADFLAYILVALLVVAEPFLQKVYDEIVKRRFANVVIVTVVIAVAVGWIWYQKDLLRYTSENEIVLRDQFREKVGSGPYYSAYDYVRRNIRDSVVWVENGLPFYVYGPGYTNSVSRSEKAEYTVVFQTAWFGGEVAYPESIETSEWEGNWNLIYEDSQGRIYRRK